MASWPTPRPDLASRYVPLKGRTESQVELRNGAGLAVDVGVNLAEVRQRYERSIPVGRVPRSEEIAAVVSYLAGPYAGAVVGQVLQPNGGSARVQA